MSSKTVKKVIFCQKMSRDIFETPPPPCVFWWHSREPPLPSKNVSRIIWMAPKVIFRICLRIYTSFTKETEKCESSKKSAALEPTPPPQLPRRWWRWSKLRLEVEEEEEKSVRLDDSKHTKKIHFARIWFRDVSTIHGMASKKVFFFHFDLFVFVIWCCCCCFASQHCSRNCKDKMNGKINEWKGQKKKFAPNQICWTIYLTTLKKFFTENSFPI